ncbi:MAG TPA: DUF1579 family protein [Burkholderiaceae bacterium]|nr:DUF1579 family protein [Burkholderiaceae bacterium]
MLKLCLFLIAATAGTLAVAQEVPQLLQHMAGTWEVQQRMWPAPGAAAVDLPPAIARRQLIDGKYLEEVMEPLRGDTSQATSFRRNALFNYNAVAKRYEYTSLDTRAPQLMTEISPPRADPELSPGRDLSLQGGFFVASEWGSAKNVPFKYRLNIGDIKEGRQIVRLFLTPRAVLPKKEFLAFEYVYSQRQ